MPGFFMHYLAGEKVVSKLPTDAAEAINKHRRVFDLGLQGPDFFDYFGAPLKGDESVQRFSHMLHERSVDEWLSTVFRYIRKQADEDKEIILPFFLGYLVHYCVDCAINPYISYNVGFPTPGAELPERFAIYRRRFSTAMDTVFLQKQLNKTPQQMEIDKLFWVEYSELLEICRMYPVNLKTIYGKDISREDIIKSYQDMNEKLKKRIKPGFLKTTTSLKEFFDKNLYKGTYTETIYVTPLPEIDYLNEKHSEWLLPWDNRYPSAKSVDELYDAAIEKAITMLSVVYEGLNGEVSDVQAVETIGGNSFMTGIAWNAPMLMKYFDCVYKADEEKIATKIDALTKKRLKDE